MKPFQSPVSCQYGAPMGRPNTVTESDYPVKFRLQRMSMISYDYDQGGAYWGGPSPEDGQMYCAWGDGAEEVQIVYIRAKSRTLARDKVTSQFPNAQFYR